MLGGPKGWCPPPPGAPSMSATTTVSGLGANGRRPCRPLTISCTGAAAARPTSPTCFFCPTCTPRWSIGAPASITLGNGAAATASPSSTIDLPSDAAVIAAIRAYYVAEDKAGETGSIELVRSVTTGPGTPAYENLKQYFIQQAAKNRASVITRDDFSAWNVVVTRERADVRYAIVQHGFDVELDTRRPVEAATTTPSGLYDAAIVFQSGTRLI